MRAPFYLHASLPAVSLLSLILPQSIIASAELPLEAIGKARALINRRNIAQWPAARAAQSFTAPEELVERNIDQELVDRQNYYAFSGAIYIVGANGQQLTGLNAASPAYCPSQAPQSCGNIGVWNWCCPTGNTCAWADAAETYVGCCPAGYTCQLGSISQNQIQTVTVYITTTQYVQTHGPTTVIDGGSQWGGMTTTTPQGGIVVVGQTTADVTYNGYCTTIFARGGNLPTTAAVPCGVALVVNDAVRPVARQVLGMVVAFWCMLFISFGSFRMRK